MASSMARLAATALFVWAAIACGGSQTPLASGYTVDNPKVGQERATSMAEAALRALDGCHYDAWSADWDDAMKAAIGADTFATFCASFNTQHGKFVSVESITKSAAQTAGHVKWLVIARFERGSSVEYSFVIRADSDLISGSHVQDVS